MNTVAVIKLEVPLEYEALHEAAELLYKVADGNLTRQGEKPEGVPTPKPEAPAETKPQSDVPPPPPAEDVPPPPPPPPPPMPGDEGESATNYEAAKVERDSRGYAHDERIHITPGKFKSDGEWKNRRGMKGKPLLKTVEAELEAARIVAPAADAVPPPPPAAVPPPPAEAVPPPPPAAPAEGTPPPPPPAAEATAAPGPVDYPHLIGKITQAIKTDKLLTQEQVNGILTSNGVTAMPLLAAATPDVWQKISDTIDVMVGV